MKMLRNVMVVVLMGVAVLSIAMELDTQSDAWQKKSMQEKLQILKKEKADSIKRFQQALRNREGQDTIQKEADTATKLDKIEKSLLIEQSGKKIADLEADLAQERVSAPESTTRSQLDQKIRQLERDLDKERDKLKKLQEEEQEENE